MSELLSEAFMLIAEVAKKDGVIPLNAHPDCWVRRLDEHWTFAVNGGKEKRTCNPLDTMGAEIDPYHAAVWFNGWLAGLFNPCGGAFVAGSLGNEDAFIAALKKELAGVPT